MFCSEGLLTAVQSKKCVSMSILPCMVTQTTINLNNDEFHYYSFIISIKICIGNYDHVEDQFSRLYSPNKIGINESKTLAKHISSECGCEFDGGKCNSR